MEDKEITEIFVDTISQEFDAVIEFLKMHPTGVTILARFNGYFADIAEIARNSNVEIIQGVICKMTTEEVDDIVLDFNSKFRQYYKDNFNSAYYQLGRYLDLMDEERNGAFSRHLIKNPEMRDVLDTTLKLSYNRFAEFAKKINGKDILIIDDTVCRGQSIKEACNIMQESYAPKSITVLTLLSKLS